MIHDSLKNSSAFEKFHPRFKQAFDFIHNTDFSTLEDGKIELDGTQLYVSIATIKGKEKKDALIETHNKYIDIQLPLVGVETIGWKAGSELKDVSDPYNPEKDITFFHDRPTTYTQIHPGEFVVYYPEDGHAPGIGEGEIRKVVVKIAL